jgi:predicted nucleic acid-binding protein
MPTRSVDEVIPPIGVERDTEPRRGKAIDPLPAIRHDAHLAALALQHGLIVCSTDGDFARYPAVRWENPLAQDA